LRSGGFLNGSDFRLWSDFLGRSSLGFRGRLFDRSFGGCCGLFLQGLGFRCGLFLNAFGRRGFLCHLWLGSRGFFDSLRRRCWFLLYGLGLWRSFHRLLDRSWFGLRSGLHGFFDGGCFRFGRGLFYRFFGRGFFRWRCFFCGSRFAFGWLGRDAVLKRGEAGIDAGLWQFLSCRRKRRQGEQSQARSG
jgi:hypothetical protein